MPTATRGAAALILLGALLAQAPLAGTAAAYESRDPSYRAAPGVTPRSTEPSAVPASGPTTAPIAVPASGSTAAPIAGPASRPTDGPTTAPTAVPTDGPSTPPTPDPTAVDDKRPPVAHSWSELATQVQQTSPNNPILRASSTAEQSTKVMRCFKLEDENYCLGLGFVDQVPTGAQLSAAVEPAPTSTTAGEVGVEQDIDTGDQSPAAFVAERTAMTKGVRVSAELEEMQTAWDGHDKARALRLFDSATASTPPATPSPTATPSTATPLPTATPSTATPLPTATSSPTRSTPSAPTASTAYASSAYIMKGFQTSQEKGYWCGPATFQAIDWADDRQKDTQTSWAKDLGSTSSGTAISSMVKQTNLKTTWDIAAGTYIVQSVSGWTAQRFLAVHQKHLGDGAPAPVIEHVQLLKRYFPYLAFNHSGHYQVGRGYNMKTGTIGIFEVFNERRFNSRGNTTNGPKNIPASSMLNATLANSFKNIGL